MLFVSLMFWKGDDDDEDDDEEEDDDDSLLRGPAFLFSLGGLYRRCVRVPQSRWRTMSPGSLREVPQVASRYLSPPRVHPTLAFDLRTYGLRRFTSPCLRGPSGPLNAKKQVSARPRFG